MSSDHKFSKLPPRAQLNAVREKQGVLAEIKVQVLTDHRILIHRPEGDSPQMMAGVIDLLAQAIHILTQQMIEKGESRIEVVNNVPGMN